ELGEDGVEQDAAVRIILGAENVERAGRRNAQGRGGVVAMGRGRLRDRLDGGGEPEFAAAARLARHGQIAAHRLGDALDEREPETGAAVTAADLRVRLRERSKQSLELGGFEPDAAV